MNRRAQASETESAAQRVRLDKWLWAARFYKTRALASEEIGKNRVSVNGQVAKASREMRPGDVVSLRQAGFTREVQVLGLSEVRGPAPVAQSLYAETPHSLQARQEHLERLKLAREPALSIEQGRPTKKDRRQLAQWERWSALAPPPEPDRGKGSGSGRS
jgi:ribosome-associated heat shock protein Hsp15